MKVIRALLTLLGMVVLAGCTPATDTSNASTKIGAIQYVEHPSLTNALNGFEERLQEEGLDVTVETVNLQGDPSLTTTAPKKYAGDEYALVYAISTPVAEGAKRALPDKDIVFSAVTDPVAAGLVSEAEDGSRISGVTDAVSAEEQLRDFLELFPEVETVGTIYSTAESNSEVQVQELEAACQKLGLELKTVGVNHVNDIGEAIATLTNEIDVYYALTDNTVAAAIPVVADALIEHGILSLSAEEGQVEKGLLMSHGVDYYAHGRQAAELAICVLNGEDIQNLPIEANQTTVKKVNLETARALELDNLDAVTKDAVLVNEEGSE